MILVDANVLLYAYDASSAFHERSRRWLEQRLSGDEPVGLAWVTLLAFLRITTNPRAVARAFTLDQAARIVASWLEQPCVMVVAPGARHWDILHRLLRTAQARGPLVMDAHLAALAIEHGATLASADRGFARFDGLHVENPVAE
jgi:hypothetical protein